MSRTLDALSNNWVSRSAVTVESDRAVLSRIMLIVTSAVRIIILYIDVEHGLASVECLADFSGFIFKVITRQKLTSARGFEFPLVVVATLL